MRKQSEVEAEIRVRMKVEEDKINFQFLLQLLSFKKKLFTRVDLMISSWDWFISTISFKLSTVIDSNLKSHHIERSYRSWVDK